jgi:hypothetical protein
MPLTFHAAWQIPHNIFQAGVVEDELISPALKSDRGSWQEQPLRLAGAAAKMSAIHPNWVAYLALLIWPVVALLLYSKLPVGQATLWTILGGYLLLPVGAQIKLAGVPAFDKQSIPNLAALIGCALFTGRLPKFFRGFGLAEFLILLLLVGPFITSMLNADPIRIRGTFLPGVGSYDALSASVEEFIFILPFFLGRQFLRSSEDNAEILRVMVIAGLAYSLPMLFEIRMSPQLHNWIYGYFPTSFGQEIRSGGFRPVVFLGHGLLVAFFAMTSVVAAAALWRTRSRVGRLAPGGITVYLGFVLLLCKTLSALLYAAGLVPLVRWASPRLQLRVASVLVIIALAYPLLRVADMVPTASIVSAASAISADRAQSIEFRFHQEDQLLDRAWERPWFGWGRFGRNRVYNGWMGRDTSVTDGHWIITMGTFGIVGFVAEFCLLALPVFRAAMALKFAQSRQEGVYLAALALIVAINIFDLLPNSSISPWTWFLVGALLGRTEAIETVARRQPSLEKLSPQTMQLQSGRSFGT